MNLRGFSRGGGDGRKNNNLSKVINLITPIRGNGNASEDSRECSSKRLVEISPNFVSSQDVGGRDRMVPKLIEMAVLVIEQKECQGYSRSWGRRQR